MTGASGPIVALGEVLLRLSPPGRMPLRQSRELAIEVGGAEANVLAALAALGHATSLVTALPKNPLGALAQAALGSRGIDTRHTIVRDGRMGLYFLETGQGRRPARVVYDRTESAFARAGPNEFDLDQALAEARLLHLSGITPALGEKPAALALAAALKANEIGVPVCFDGNFRAQLWEARGSDPRPLLAELFGCADILLGNHRDIALVTGRSFPETGTDRRKAAVDAAFDAFPRLSLIASTARQVFDSDQHALSARVDSREASAQTEDVIVTGIVDRIGTGDAFAAGVLDRWLTGAPCEDAARTGLALAVLKHTVPGDVAQFDRADIDAVWSENRDIRR